MSSKAKKAMTAPTGKPKLSKTKSLVVKTTAKPKIAKRSGSTTSVKEKRSGKGAKVATARARTGHSLYPEESEAEHVTSSARGIDRCSELLYHLLDRKKAGGRDKFLSSPCYGKVCEVQADGLKPRIDFLMGQPDSPDTVIAALMSGERNTPRTRAPVVDIRTPFNQRLMSSTPDLDKILSSAEPLVLETDADLSYMFRQAMMAKRSNYEAADAHGQQSAPSHMSDPMDLSNLVIQSYSQSPKSSVNRRSYQRDSFASLVTDKEALLKSDVLRKSEDPGNGDVPRMTDIPRNCDVSKKTDVSRNGDVSRKADIPRCGDVPRKSDVPTKSDIADFQCYLHRETKGFSPPLFLQGGRSDAAGIKELDDHSDSKGSSDGDHGYVKFGNHDHDGYNDNARPSAFSRPSHGSGRDGPLESDPKESQESHRDVGTGEPKLKSDGIGATDGPGRSDDGPGQSNANGVRWNGALESCANWTSSIEEQRHIDRNHFCNEGKEIADATNSYHSGSKETADGINRNNSCNEGSEAADGVNSNKSCIEGSQTANGTNSNTSGDKSSEKANGTNSNNSCNDGKETSDDHKKDKEASGSASENGLDEASLMDRMTPFVEDTPRIRPSESSDRISSLSENDLHAASHDLRASENDFRLPPLKSNPIAHLHERRAILGRKASKTQSSEMFKYVGSITIPASAKSQIPKASLVEIGKLDPDKLECYDVEDAIPYRHANPNSLNINLGGASKPLLFLHDCVETPANSPVNLSARPGQPGPCKIGLSRSSTLVGRSAASDEPCFKRPLNFLQTILDSNSMDTPMNSPNKSPMASEGGHSNSEHERILPQYLVEEFIQGNLQVNYLLTKLANMAKHSGSSEMVCVVQDLCNKLDRMLTFDIRNKMDQMLQPLRNENIQLNRRIKTLNQQLRERERMERESNSHGVNFELLNLQTDNVSLNRQLREKHEALTQVVTLVDDLRHEKEQVKQERQQLIMLLDDKNKERLKIREECVQENSRLERQLDLMTKKNEGSVMRLRAAQQQIDVLETTLKHRDHYIVRLEQLVKTLKEGIEGILGSLDANCNIRGSKSSTTNTFNLQRMLLLLDRSSSPAKSTTSDPGHQKEARPVASTSKNLDNEDIKTHPPVSPLTKAALRKHEQLTKKAGKLELNNDCQKDNKAQVDGKKSEKQAPKESAAYEKQREPEIEKATKTSEKVTKEHMNEKTANVPLNEKASKVSECRYSSSPKPDEKLGKGQRSRDSSQDPNRGTEDRDYNVNSQANGGGGGPFTNSDDVSESRQDNLCYGVLNRFPKRDVLLMSGVHEMTGTGLTSGFNEMTGTGLMSGVHQMTGTSDVVLNQQGRILTQPDGNENTVRFAGIMDGRLAGAADARTDRRTEPRTDNDDVPSAPHEGRSVARSLYDDFGGEDQEELYRGTELDLSLSTIEDDLRSIATASSISSLATVDDRAFREGMAALDAHIAKVQQALQRTKKKFEHIH